MWELAAMAMHPLTRFREKNDLTCAQLAERLGVARNTVWRWEHRQRRPDESLLPAIVRITGIQPSALGYPHLEAAE
jgi:transcriptional regulator with XRE-family HTH domain